MSKILQKLFLIALMLVVSGCIHVEIKGAGVFKSPVKHDEKKHYIASINIPVGTYGDKPKFFNANGSLSRVLDEDGSEIDFPHLGKCGAQFSLTGIMVPIIPFVLPNFCESDGFYVAPKWYLAFIGVTLQLHYNNTTYDPYIENGSVKFKIVNFSEFKRAPDKSLIIHKQNPDGTTFTKSLPFDWKIVVETSGGL